VDLVVDGRAQHAVGGQLVALDRAARQAAQRRIPEQGVLGGDEVADEGYALFAGRRLAPQAGGAAEVLDRLAIARPGQAHQVARQAVGVAALDRRAEPVQRLHEALQLG